MEKDACMHARYRENQLTASVSRKWSNAKVVSDSLDDRQIFWPNPVLYGVTRLVVGFIIFGGEFISVYLRGRVEVNLFHHSTVLLLRLIFFLILIFLAKTLYVLSRFANFLFFLLSVYL